MEGRKWEELNEDCLENVLERVGLESVLLSIPFVCKSWHKATLSPLCWQTLEFQSIYPRPFPPFDPFITSLIEKYQFRGTFSLDAFFMSIVKRSNRSATLLSLPARCTDEFLSFVADECPNLLMLEQLFDIDLDVFSKIAVIVSKMKNLMSLYLGSSSHMQEILAQVHIHCKNFCILFVEGAHIEKDEAAAIVALPNIKFLVLKDANIQRENLVMILRGCKQLSLLDVTDCIGFVASDQEILKLASHIENFLCQGSNV